MTEKVTSVKYLREVLAAENCAPRKSLGQNFLTDENILRKIVDAGNPGAEDTVLEIGPGLGALTGVLLERAGRVIAVEYDRGLYQILRRRFAASPRLTLINQDFMKLPLEELFAAPPQGPAPCHCQVIANLPYYITTPIIFKLLESGIPWSLMVFLVQKEVAQRITARPGSKEYGALTVMLDFFGRAEVVAPVPKTVFYPAPQVDSAIIRLIPEPRQYDPALYPFVQRVVQAAFGQRRKTLSNTLREFEAVFGGRDELAGFLRAAGIDPGLRGETLGIDSYLAIAREIRERSGNPHCGFPGAPPDHQI